MCRFSSWLAVSIVILSTVGSSPGQTTAPSAEELAKDPALFLTTARKALKWDEPAEPCQIAGPLYFVGTQGLSVYLITGDQGHVLIHTGMPGSGPLIAASIRKLGFKPEDVKLLLAGHAHCDHVGGLAYLKKLTGAKITLIEQEKELFESGGKLDFFYGQHAAFAFDPATVDQVFQDGAEIKLGQIVVTALLTNGHTKGSVTYVTKIAEGDTSYRVVFPDGTGINPGYRLMKEPSYAGIADNYRRTLRILESLEPDIWLHPHNQTYGHDDKRARSAQEGAKAWVDPQGYKKWVAVQRSKMEDTIGAELRAALRRND